MSSARPTGGATSGGIAFSRPADCAQRQRVHGSCAGCEVRDIAACSAIPSRELHELEQLGGKIRLSPGTALVREGDARTEVHTLVSGMARQVRLLPDGRRHVAGFLLPGDFIGFSAASHHRHSVEAVTESVLCSFSLPSVRRLRERYPDFDANLFEQACGELDKAGSYLTALARMTPVERLSAFDVVVKSPGISPYRPEALAADLRAFGSGDLRATRRAVAAGAWRPALRGGCAGWAGPGSRGARRGWRSAGRRRPAPAPRRGWRRRGGGR